MKFSAKLTLFIMLMVSVLFSVGGYLLINQNFTYSLDALCTLNAQNHLTQKYIMQTEMRNSAIELGAVLPAEIAQIAKQTRLYAGVEFIAVYDENQNEIYGFELAPTKQAIQKSIEKSEDGYIIDETGNMWFMLIASKLNVGEDILYLVNSYDISTVFMERQRQYQSFLILDAILILLACTLAGIFAKLITTPLKKLTKTALQISGGEYAQRTAIKTHDEIGELADSFNKMANAIEEKIKYQEAIIQAKDDFVANFSHELKTPMTSIMGYADMIRSHENEVEVQIKAANTIYKESKRLSELSVKLLDLMSLSDGNVKLCAVFSTSLYDKTQASLASAVVLADKLLIECALKNLVLNAENAGAKKIDIVGVCTQKGYQITVSDDGCGISPEELLRVKEAFYMVDKSRSKETGGTGLGLALCEKIAKLHHTELTIKSTVGVGTEISFILEVAQ